LCCYLKNLAVGFHDPAPMILGLVAYCH